MNKKLAKLEFFGFIFVSVLGVIMHFAYEWSNESKVIALISPINESPIPTPSRQTRRLLVVLADALRRLPRGGCA